MKKVKSLFWAALMLLCGQNVNAQEASVVETSPPSMLSAKPGTRWWWHGSAVDRENLQWSLDQYAQAGIGTVEITPIFGVQGNEKNDRSFLSPEWMQSLRDVEDIAAKKHIQVDMNCGTGWPFGGPEVPLEEAACKLILIDTVVTTRVAKDLVLEVPEKEKPHSRLLVQRDFPVNKRDYRRVIALYESRTLQKVKRAAPGGEGYVIDHFDSTAVAHYLDRFERAFAQTNTPYPNTFFNDSYEVYDADWTPSLLDEFFRRCGYRLENHLPALANGNPKVLTDYRETLAELLLNNFTRQWVAWSHKHGVQVRNQAHGSPANLIDVYAAVDVPEIEGYGLSDFGIKGLRTDPGMTIKNFSDLSMLKYASSASHITGKPLTSSETFTWLTEHFRTSLSQMKPDMDLMFCAGVNRMFFHGTCYSPKDEPWPGRQFYAAIDMSPTNTIWRDAPNLMKYIERCQNYLQWGKSDNDFLVYLPVRNMWADNPRERLMMFDIHTMDKKAPDFIRAILAIDSLGFDCDYISDQFLLTTTYDGHFLRTAAGTAYKALVIPGDCIMPKHVRQHIDELGRRGANIIKSITQADLVSAAKPETIKSELHLHMIRRSNPVGYHYFIANLTPNDVDEWAMLANDFKDAFWYDPMTGKKYAVETDGKWIKVMLRSGESLILQTLDQPKPEGDKASSGSGLKQRPRLPNLTGGNTIVLNKGWKLRFENSEPAIKKTYKLDQLRTWETLDRKTRTLMGTGVYQCNFEVNQYQLNDSHTWQIDLGDVRESARVSINGHDIGCAWAVPYVLWFDKSVLHEGINTISIAVTNLPANHIAELDRKGVKWRKMKEINMVDINYKNTSFANWKPMPSGLNSTVRIIRVN